MVLEKVAEALAEKAGTDAAAIGPETTFEELKLDSLDIVDTMMTLEDIFGVSLEASDGMKRVGDLVAYIEQMSGNA